MQVKIVNRFKYASLLFSFILISKVSYCQVEESEIYVYLFSDKIIYGNIIEFKKLGHFKSCLILDSKTFPTNDVKYYYDGDGYYANIKDLIPSGNSHYARRYCTGKINLYNKKHFKIVPTGDVVYLKEVTDNYYSKGFGDLKEIKYRNLKNDLIDNPESKRFLSLIKKTRKTQAILYFSGGAAILVGAGIITNKQIKSFNAPYINTAPNYIPEAIVIVGGAIGCIVSLSLSINKQFYLSEAIEAYKY